MMHGTTSLKQYSKIRFSEPYNLHNTVSINLASIQIAYLFLYKIQFLLYYFKI